MKKFVTTYTSIAFGIAPALGMYEVLPGTSLAQLLLLLAIPLVFVLRGEKITVLKDEMYFFFAILFLSVMTFVVNFQQPWFQPTLWLTNFFQIFVAFFILMFLPQLVDLKTMTTAATVLGIAATVIVIIQRIQQMTFGFFYMDFFIPGLQSNRPVQEMSFTRPCAFFTEPAHMCIFLIPLLYWSLSKKKYLLSATFLTGMLLTSSSTGFLSIFIVFLCWMHDVKMKIGRQVFAVLALGLVLLAAIQFAPNVMEENVERLSGFSSEESGQQRLLGPLAHLRSFSVFQWFTGIGFNQVQSFAGYIGADRPLCVNYANSFVYSMLCFGLFGVIILIGYLAEKFIKCRVYKGYWFILIAVLGSDQILFNVHLLYLLVFVLIADSINSFENRESISNRC